MNKLISISEFRDITDVWHKQEITITLCRDMIVDKIMGKFKEHITKVLTEELDNCGLYEDDEPICTLIMSTKRIEEIRDRIIKEYIDE